jgi:glycosyltransferase involved in cell wall biosynthesis
MTTVENIQIAEETRKNIAVVRERALWARPHTIFDGWQTRMLSLTNFAGRVYPALHGEMMTQLLDIQPQERVLDIGGGDSPFVRANVVTDAFPDMNAHRSGRSACLKAEDGSDMEFVQCFAEELPFEDKAFDVAYCRMVLEHAIDPAAACREMMRVARRGFLETPSPLAEYLGGHPTHRWIVWVEHHPGHPPTLVFRRKPFRRAPLGYALRGSWFHNMEFHYAWEWQYRNVVCTQLTWEDTFAFRVEDDGEPEDYIDYDDPAQAAEAHLDAAIASLYWGDVPASIIIPDAEHAITLRPEWAVAHNTLGCALWLDSRFEEACTAFQRAAALEPQRAAYSMNALLTPARTANAQLMLVTLAEALGEAPAPGLTRCAVTSSEVDRAARLLLRLRPAPAPVSNPAYTRVTEHLIAAEEWKSGGGTEIQDTKHKAQGIQEKGKEENLSKIQNPESPIASSCSLTWHAPLRDPSGYADEARHFLFALAGADVNVTARAIKWSDKSVILPAERERLLQKMLRRPAQAGSVQVCHILAPYFQPDPHARANVGRTMFETDRLPDGWAQACNRMDAVWVPGAFNVETFAAAGVERDKLRVVPGAIDLAPYNPDCAPLRIDGGRGFNFLSVFDWTLRKGWDTLIRAFVEEFDQDEEVALVLKTHSSLGYTTQQMLDFLIAYVTDILGRDPNRIPDVVLQDANVPDARMPNLYRAANCYVMPSRGEGWGRPYMEAMAMGLPVIATGWSGQTAFLNADNSYVLDYEIVDVPEPAWRETPTFQGHRWAEPSCTHLRQLMRRAFEDRAEGRQLGQQGRAHLETHFTYAPVAAIVRAELERLA